jgi:hypothetical protein
MFFGRLMMKEGCELKVEARPADARPNGFIRAGQSDGDEG